MKPFSIRIFLPDGTADGVRVIEKSNWTGVGVVVPRAVLNEAKKREEFGRTGVYVLVGHDDEGELPTIYIGQGDPVRARLEQHLAKKDFWTSAIFFVTRDDSLNKRTSVISRRDYTTEPFNRSEPSLTIAISQTRRR